MLEIESDGELTRAEVAAFHREFADEIADGIMESHQDPAEGPRTDETVEEGPAATKRITFIVGGDSATVAVTDTVEFDVEIESRSPMLSSGVSQESEPQLSWELDQPDEMPEDGIEPG